MPRAKQRRSPSPEQEAEPQRRIHVPEDEPAPAIRTNSTKHMELTPDVKSAAANALDAIRKVDYEALTESRITRLLLRCTDGDAADSLRKRLGIPVARGQSDATGLRPQGRAVTIDLERYLPEVFNELLADVAEGEVASLPVTVELATALRQFVSTFGDAGVVRIQLDDPREHPDSSLEPNRRCLTAAHRMLVRAGQQMLEVISDNPIHQVCIRPSANLMKSMTFTIDGRNVELLSRAQRALCTLALLLPEGPVDCKKFMELYSGDSTDARRDFHTVVRALRPQLPQMDWKATSGRRWISGLQIRSEASSQQLTKFLEEHRKSSR